VWEGTLAKEFMRRQFWSRMKSKVAIVILVVVCLALGVGLVTEQRKHAREKKEREDQIALQTKNLQETARNLEEQKQVNMTLETDLKSRGEDLKGLSNNLSKVISDLEKSDAQAKATAEQLRSAQADLAKKDQKIGELEGERLLLGKQMDQLTNSIGDLSKQIVATEKRLATEQGEKAFLVKELNRMRAEKAELERQFNDLAVLRAQVGKLKEELAIARRLEFIRLNLFGTTAKGGAEKLMTPARPPAASGTNYDLNVELRPTAPARVVTPPPPATNIPAGPLREALRSAVETNAAPKVAPATPPK
jgi:septal ring factor EnvC (AmiA/AmiB activator)